MPAANTLALTLDFESGPRVGETLELPPRRFVLGRGKSCDIEVPDGRVSKEHCLLSFDGESVQIDDLGSVNRTVLNGRPVRRATARDGDLLRLGDTTLRVRLAARDPTTRIRPGAPAPSLHDTSVGPRRGTHLEVPGYEILGPLGRGATSTVVQARDGEGALVAIKILSEQESRNPANRERFHREVAAIQRLSHPNIVRILEHGEAQGRPYGVLELVHGETLRTRLQRGPLPVALALHVARQIASALEHVRRHDIVHRDVKPDNILLDGSVAKLADFGLAKPLAVLGESGPTQVGEVLGTLAYMSPEQLQCSAVVDHRSDVYALGATLHHMLAGQPPFSRRESLEYLDAILNQEPPALATLRREVPPAVSDLVLRCLRKKPEERYATAGEIVAALALDTEAPTRSS